MPVTLKYRSFSLFISLFLFSISLSVHAQILDSVPETVWINNTSDNTNSKTQLLSEQCIGNYELLDRLDILESSELTQIAKHNSGTLFMVAKVDSFDPELNLMRLGDIRIYPENVFLAGSNIEKETFNAKGSILKLSYQMNSRFKDRYKGRVFISEHLHIAEIIYYDHGLSAEQARVVESYLAMKYSINISENEDEDLRNYLNTAGKEVWRFGSDQFFDREIMALGRKDDIKFRQSQTYTSDASSIKVSLDPEAELGSMPDKYEIQDGSLLIISKNDLWPGNGPCGSLLDERSWMFRFVNWSSTASSFYVTINDDVDTGLVPVMTDGLYTKPLSYKYQTGQMTLDVPIIDEAHERNFYIIWTKQKQGCPPLGEVMKSPCDSIAGNQIHIKVKPETLPVDVMISHKSSGAYKELTMTNSDLQLDQLPAGEYEVQVSNPNFRIADEVVLFTNCQASASSTDINSTPAAIKMIGSASTPVLVNSDPAMSQINPNGDIASNYGGFEADTDGLFGQVEFKAFDTKKIIECYPNPAKTNRQVDFQFIGFSEDRIDINVFDNNGKVMWSGYHEKGSLEPFSHSFDVSGPYMVKFSTEGYSETKHIIIY